MPEMTYYPAASRDLGAYLALPHGVGPWPGVVVIMDLLGLTDDIRQQADRLAAAGYIAFAPDLYSGRGLKCVLATLKSARSGSGEAFEDIEAARQWLLAREDCSGQVGVIGFCIGGGFALLSAPRYGFDAASVNYGEVPAEAAQELAGACPIVASYGRRDRTLRGRAARLEDALQTLGVQHDVKEYPDAGHSFLNRFDMGAPVGLLFWVVGFRYHHPSAEDAWRRILTFFDQHLRGAGPGGETGTATGEAT